MTTNNKPDEFANLEETLIHWKYQYARYHTRGCNYGEQLRVNGLIPLACFN